MNPLVPYPKINPQTKGAMNQLTKTHFAPKITNNVRSCNIQVTRRDRQCAVCAEKILKGSPYVCFRFRYDRVIITMSIHLNCHPMNPYPPSIEEVKTN